MCISEFGPLPCSIITTTRKCFTVLASVIFFGNSLSGQQWIGAALVFTGIEIYIIFKRCSLCFTNFLKFRTFSG